MPGGLGRLRLSAQVVARDLKSLSTFLTDRLMQVAGIDDVRSMICLEEIKPTSPLPVE
jgi:Lrp/AsnC family leucine-responsive transcriptional regulator